MESMKIKCEIVTPLLMHGANGKNAELREQSFKGVMRFWWRAINGNLSLKELKEKEAEIFGNTSGKSSFRMRLKNKNIHKMTYFAYKKELQNKYGLKYLWYPIMMAKKDDTPWLIEKGSFEIEFYFKDEESKSKSEIIKVLNYINFFGNFGARSRRGAGSIKFESDNLIKFTGDNKENLKEFIKKNFEKNTNENYSTFAKEVYIFNSKRSWTDALNYIGNLFSNFRRKNKGEVFKTPAFGFPIRHRNRDIFLGVKEKGNNCEFLERRASLLIFKVYKVNENTYFPLIIWLEGKLLRDGYKIGKKIKKCDKNELKEVDESLIKKFFNSLKKGSYVKW